MSLHPKNKILACQQYHFVANLVNTNSGGRICWNYNLSRRL